MCVSAILHYRSFPNNVKRKLKNQHAFIHSTVLILILVAGCAAYVSHVYSSPPIPNFYSLHSWLGIFTAVMFIIQVNVIQINVLVYQNHIYYMAFTFYITLTRLLNTPVCKRFIVLPVSRSQYSIQRSISAVSCFLWYFYLRIGSRYFYTGIQRKINFCSVYYLFLIFF